MTRPARPARTVAAVLGLLLGIALLPALAAGAATADAGTAAAAASTGAAEDEVRNRRPPLVRGEQRLGGTLRATPGRWSPAPDRLRYRWLRDGEPVARGRRYRVRPADVGHRLRVQVTAVAAGLRPARAVSARARKVAHRVPVRRTVSYHVETRGRIGADVRTFRRLVQQTFDDPRGWRGAGVRFRQVRRGGAFTVVLAEARTVPSFSPVCSSEWSCRVGRFVIINQTRWQHASPAWNRAGRSLRDYRHMVVNHETGHWLGRGHTSCGGRGRPAPVMMQQSKGRDGCRFNPWPTLTELRAVR